MGDHVVAAPPENLAEAPLVVLGLDAGGEDSSPERPELLVEVAGVGGTIGQQLGLVESDFRDEVVSRMSLRLAVCWASILARASAGVSRLLPVASASGIKSCPMGTSQHRQ